MNRWLFLWRKWTRQLWGKATVYAGVGGRSEEHTSELQSH